MNFLGIDAGLIGAMTLVDKDGGILFCEPIPVVEIERNGKRRNQYDINEILQILKRLNSDYPIAAMMVERLRPLPNQRAQVGFSLGYSQGVFKTLAVALNVAYFEIEPKEWQREMFGKKSVVDTKVESINKAMALAPTFNFRRSERCKALDHNMCDSFLIARYLRVIYK